MNSKAVFAGTFDPFTLGHYDIARRASNLFDKVYIAVADTQSKNVAFSLEKRIEIAKLSLKDLDNVVVVPFSGFLVDFMKANGIKTMVRGLRNTIDFEYEKSLFSVYKSQYDEVEACYLMSSNDDAHISSSLVREVLSLGGDPSAYLRKDALKEIL